MEAFWYWKDIFAGCAGFWAWAALLWFLLWQTYDVGWVIGKCGAARPWGVVVAPFIWFVLDLTYCPAGTVFLAAHVCFVAGVRIGFGDGVESRDE